MTSKERAVLISQAMSLESVVNVGKAGISPELTENVNEALKARELIKITVQKGAPEDVKTIARTLSERTRSELVQVIGRKVVLYRFSNDLKEHIPLSKR